MAMNPSLALLVGLILLVGMMLALLFIAHKVRRVHLALFDLSAGAATVKDLDKAFSQAEALVALHLELGFNSGLPATRGWAASPDFLLVLARHALRCKPVVIVECSSGVSTLILARCAQLNGAGHVFSLENNKEFADKTIANLVRHRLSDFATVVHAPLISHTIGGKNWPWYSLDGVLNEQRIDWVVVDGPPSQTGHFARYPAGPLLFLRLAPGGIVFLDDAARPDEQKIIERWREEFGLQLLSQPECEKGCAILQRTN